MLYHNQDYIKAAAGLSSAIARFFEVLADSRAIGERFWAMMKAASTICQGTLSAETIYELKEPEEGEMLVILACL